MGFHVESKSDFAVLFEPRGGATVSPADNGRLHTEHELGARLFPITAPFWDARLRGGQGGDHRLDAIGCRALCEAEHSVQCPGAGAGGHTDVETGAERPGRSAIHRGETTAGRRAYRPARRSGPGGGLFHVDESKFVTG